MNGWRSIFLTFFLMVSGWSETSKPTPTLTLEVPMRDGIRLPADVYLPSFESKKLPVLLLRSPAGRQAQSALPFASFTQFGYAVVIQDTRSAMDKEGKTMPYISDGWGAMQDGYDTVMWLSKQPFSNGQIGTAGASAIGITQLLMAPTNPSPLKAQYITTAAASMFHHAVYSGGRFQKEQVESWLHYYARDPSVKEQVCRHCCYDNFWQTTDSTTLVHKVEVPAVHVGGWYDTFLPGTLESFLSRQYEGGEGARGKQKLLIGPWSHFWPGMTKVGDFEVPEAGRNSSIDLSPRRWFAHYLKGEDNGVDREPPVVYFVMGPFVGSSPLGNKWKTSSVWPVPARIKTYYLSPDRTLDSAPPLPSSLPYAHDSSHPVPTLGGRNLFIESGPKDQTPLEQRVDVIAFTSAPLDQDVEVTGPLKALLYLQSTRRDIDVAVRLTDVSPDGKSYLIADGLTNLTDNPNLQHRGEVIVDLSATSYVFAKGHQIRLLISGSNFPRFDISPTGQTQQTLYFGIETPSSLLLPVVTND